MEGFVECPRTKTLVTLVTCWHCERAFQINSTTHKVECLSDDGRTNNFVAIVAGEDVE